MVKQFFESIEVLYGTPTNGKAVVRLIAGDAPASPHPGRGGGIDANPPLGMMGGIIYIGGNSTVGRMNLLSATGKSIIHLGGNGLIKVGGFGSNGHLGFFDSNFIPTGSGDFPDLTHAILHFNAQEGSLKIGNKGVDGELAIFPDSVTSNNNVGEASVFMDGNNRIIALRDNKGNDSILLNGNPGGGNSNSISVRDKKTENVFACSFTDKSAGIFVGAHSTELSPGSSGKSGAITLRDQKGSDSIVLNGEAGQIHLGISETLGLVSQSILLDGSRGNIWLGATENPPSP